ncbi:MAG: AmmeMemoRadiSam system protein B [Spirochaetes bacterium GWB1_59_5]|nr:MAG: AmmeMemoRadiSam system protein B [Spirochaetes bacterium GWB1_59_5]
MESYGVNRRTREAIVAGIFYPDDQSVLKARIDDALKKASKVTTAGASGRPVAILSPHAAFEYACDVQAAAWASVEGNRVDTVVVIAPLRRPDESGAYLPESASFQTPLGDVQVDSGACADLESCSTLFSSNDGPHFESHAIEVQLPFMRFLFPDALLVPVLVCGDATVASSLARAIDVVFGDDLDRTLIVASSNLAASLVAGDASRRSDELVQLMKAMSWRDLAAQRDFAGSAAIASAMAIDAMIGARFKLLARLDSQKPGAPSSERVVNYAAAAWYPGALP